MLRLALPVLVEQLLSMLVVFSDSLLTGWYFDEQHLAAINLIVYLLWLLTSLFVVVGIGATAMIARFVGARNDETANHVANQAFLAGAVMAVFVTIAGLLFQRHFIALLQLEGEAAALSVSYLSYIFPVVPAIMLEAVGFACLRGAGDMIAGLFVMTVVNVVNILASWSLALGLGPLPELGWTGLAVGTAMGHVVGGLLVLLMFLRGRYGLRFHRLLLVPNGDLIRRLVRIGLPGGADVLAIIACQLWFVAIINQLGELAAAAHGVAIRIESLAYLPGTAFQLAAATLAGQYLGARDYGKAGRSVLLALLVGGGLISGAGVLFFFAAEPLAAVFVSNEHTSVIDTAATLLRIVAGAMPFFAATIILTGALRGAGDTRWPLIFTMLGYVGVRIPLAYVFAHSLSWGVEGAWYAMVADVVFRCVLVSFRFWHGGWKWVEV
jgi:putative MATE family efflux protein